jgi:hypothetical protein
VKTAADESYGNRQVYKLFHIGTAETGGRLFGGAYFRLIKTAFEQLKADPAFQYRYSVENPITFFDEYHPDGKRDDFPPHRDEFKMWYEDENPYSGYGVWPKEWDDGTYLTLRAVYADHLFKDEPYLSLERGAWFADGDFFISDPDTLCLPVILGSRYADLYHIGDEIKHAHIGAPGEITLTVIGFLAKDSYFYDNNNVKRILNRFMVVPAIEITYEPFLPDGNLDPFAGYMYDGMKIVNARIVTDAQSADIAYNRVKEILYQNQLYEFRLLNESGMWPQRWDTYIKERVTAILTAFFIIVLIAAVFLVQLYLKILQNKKKYGIYRLNGMTKVQTCLAITAETLMAYVIALPAFIIIRRVLYSGDARYMLSPAAIAVMPAVAIGLLCLMGGFGQKAVSKLDMSAALREYE